MELYDTLGSKKHPVYGKLAGLITADDVANRLHDEIKGKTVVITGCSPTSLGAYLAWTIASHSPKRLIVCGRSDVRLRLLASNITYRNPGIDIVHEVFDLADLSQVRAAAERINARDNVDVIICNAGIMMHPLSKTVDGIESHLGVNSTSHFVLVNLLLPKMIENGGGRVVTTSSGAYQFGSIRWDDTNYEASPEQYHGLMAYAGSKTADVLFAAALARRYGAKGIVATSVDIGGAVNDTNLAGHFTDADLEPFLNVTPRSKAEACSTQLVGAFDPEMKNHNGAFLLFCDAVEPAVDHAKGEENETRFWKLSEKLAKQEFSS